MPDTTRQRPDGRLFVTGVALVILSAAAAVWMLAIGDVVTALGLGLVLVAGVLLAGIGLSPDAAASNRSPHSR
jgi:hypothetical protein